MTFQRLEDVKKLDEVEYETRKQPGFERFHLPPTETELHHLARHGPLISFNVTDLGSHAFLVTDNSLRVLRLPNLNFEDLEKHVSIKTKGNQSRRDANLVSVGANSTIKDNIYKNTPAESMCWLWNVAVQPVFEELGLLWRDEPPSTLPCVWWVGGDLMALLPLHAAEEHRLGSTDNTMSHVVSSYAPTLKNL